MRWRRDYLTNLQERSKWTGKRTNISVGDIVLLRDKTAKRNFWPMARVKEVKAGRDGQIRVVCLTLSTDSKTSMTKTFTRAIHDLVVLIPASAQQ